MCDMPRDKDAPLAGNQAHKGGEQPALRRQRQHWARAGMLALSALGPWGSISCRAFAEDNMPRLALPRLSPEEARHLSAVRLRLPSQSPTLLQLLSALHDQLEVPVFCGLPAGSDPSEVSLTMKSTSSSWRSGYCGGSVFCLISFARFSSVPRPNWTPTRSPSGRTPTRMTPPSAVAKAATVSTIPSRSARDCLVSRRWDSVGMEVTPVRLRSGGRCLYGNKEPVR